MRFFEPGGLIGIPLFLGVVAACLALITLIPYDEDIATAEVKIHLASDGSILILKTPPAKVPDLIISTLLEPKPVQVMGSVTRTDETLTFQPLVPFISGQNYRAEWTNTFAVRQDLEFNLDANLANSPTVRFAPQAKLPANALKFYLHFSQPMEQGVFLERLRLLEADGKEVIGPFRETELWSPDGRRLTVWFHPGRQKTGVNLNEEEGPVLRENTKHTLVVASSWRSTSGVALGNDVRFDFQVGVADHEMPMMEKWQITAPKSGSREPLAVRFDEPLDPAMLASALSVHLGADLVPVEIEIDGLNWRAIPLQPWTAGSYELRADPNLEDLAGNNLTKPFEVDVSELPDTAGIPTKLAFEVR